MDADVSYRGDGHTHCARCVDRYCQPSRHSPSEPTSSSAADDRGGGGGGSSCALVDCRLGCGARYHDCKASEHDLLCPLASAPCANREYGCGATVRRCHLARHLAVCPASAVVCTMEWNRQMLRADQRPLAWPLQQLSSAAAAAAVSQSQLDVAWVARDQRRLLRSFELAGSTLAYSLRSPLTPGWPAVPFLQQPSSLASKEAPSAAGSLTAAAAPVADEVVAVSAAAAAAAAAATAAAVHENLCSRRPATKAPAAGNRPERRTPAYHVQCSLCSARRGTTRSSTDDSCLSSSILEAVGLKPGLLADDQGAGAGEQQTTGHGGSNCSSSSSGGDGHVVRAPPQPATQDQPAGEHGADAVPVSGAVMLDLVMETYNSFRVKPTSMYTFRCAESFRRGEYSSHYQNVHADIQAGLNGWFEWRCPLAAYGCSWSFHRFAASPSSDRVVFSPIVDGFGVTSGCASCPAGVAWSSGAVLCRGNEPCGCASDAAAAAAAETVPEHGAAAEQAFADRSCPAAVSDHVCGCDGGQELADAAVDCAPRPAVIAADDEPEGACPLPPDRLTGLPDELLCNILLYLDSFSLNNVALTCKVLRNICCRLLDRRGIVSLLWKSVTIANERPTWQCTSYVWTFSKHFAAVKQWHFVSDTALVNHLATCPFNKKHRFQHPDLAKHRMHPVDCEPRGKKVLGLRKQCAAERPDFF